MIQVSYTSCRTFQFTVEQLAINQRHEEAKHVYKNGLTRDL